MPVTVTMTVVDLPILMLMMVMMVVVIMMVAVVVAMVVVAVVTMSPGTCNQRQFLIGELGNSRESYILTGSSSDVEKAHRKSSFHLI